MHVVERYSGKTLRALSHYLVCQASGTDYSRRISKRREIASIGPLRSVSKGESESTTEVATADLTEVSLAFVQGCPCPTNVSFIRSEKHLNRDDSEHLSTSTLNLLSNASR